MTERQWMWCASWNYAGDASSKSAHDTHVTAPDFAEAVRLAVQNPPSPVPNTEAYYRFTLIGVVRRERVSAQWYPVAVASAEFQGPRPPTIDEQAAAEVEELVG